MAIYAKIEQLRQFGEHWESFPTPLEAAISDRDTLISDTRTTLNNGIDAAEKICRMAHKRLLQVQQEMDRAKRTPEGPSRALIQRLEKCEAAYEQARRQLEQLEAQRDRFEEGSARCAATEDQSLEAIKKLSIQGSNRLARYTQLLQEAKHAIYEDADGYIGTRALTTEERSQIREKTGWTEKQLDKCQLRPDGSLWYKTNNSGQDMERYKGVWFQRDTVTINGLRVEGIFPQFAPLFEPDTQLPEPIWSSSRETHFSWCRAQLKTAVENNPALAAQFTAAERKLIAEEKDLPDYTWHHHQQPGKMQLVRTKKLRKALHSVSHTGGYVLWCSMD